MPGPVFPDVQKVAKSPSQPAVVGTTIFNPVATAKGLPRPHVSEFPVTRGIWG